MPKKLILGTSKWGDTVSFKEATSLIDYWHYVHCETRIDTATNYPINGGGADTAILYLEDYLSANKDCRLDLTVKVGSVSRERTPDFDLTPKVLLKTCDNVLNRLGSNVKCFMVHWDMRGDYDDIAKTVEVLKGYGLDVGISGVLYPEVYNKIICDLNLKVDVQCKYSCLDTYFNKIPYQRYYSYRVSEGFTEYNLGLESADKDPRLDGFLIGPKNVEQLTKTLSHVETTRQNYIPNDNALS